tara:strand:+ start:320 stop:535 length:216 start_codon:yes stop_codon:yes gene_type:complete
MNIFINSEGCKLIKYKSIHLWDPDEVIPNKYVQNSKPITIKYERYPIANQYFILMNEINIIINVKTISFVK